MEPFKYPSASATRLSAALSVLGGAYGAFDTSRGLYLSGFAKANNLLALRRWRFEVERWTSISLYKIAQPVELNPVALAGGTTTYTKNTWYLATNVAPVGAGIKRQR